MRKSIFVMALTALCCLSACNQKKGEDVTLQVKTQYGVLEGFEENGVKKFLGVPFAQAPVGELRWKAPSPYSLGRAYAKPSSSATIPCSLTFSVT